MASDRAERRLAAILVSDIVGYSRLAAADEDRILARLRTLRSDLIDPTIAVHHGRVVKRTGDGSIVEFRSVVDAVRCAVEVQSGMIERNAGLPPERRIDFRVGIHIGDVVQEADGDLMGDGVNIAARLESVAKPGAICLSEDAYRQVKLRLDLPVSDLGERRLKNIPEPMRVYLIEVGAPALAPTPQAGAGAETSSARLALPDKPSIAVLPFQNMSGDREQDYFADGVVEDIITALSRFKNLFVIARNSSFTYKGKAVDVKEVGRELGVRYVLEGSVRKTASRVRITGQLIDAATGAHLWADRIDGDIGDIFDLQDQVTASVAAAVAPQIERAEIERSKRKPTSNLEAYDHYLLGIASLYRGTKQDSDEALKQFDLAAQRDPEFAAAYGWAAYCYVLRKARGWQTPDASQVADAVRLARSAASLGREDSVALCFAGHALAYVGHEIDDGVAFVDRGLALNSNNARGWYASGWTRVFGGAPEQAVDHLARAMRLSPVDPLTPMMLNGIGASYFFMGRYDEAALWTGKAIREWPSYAGSLFFCAASQALAGRLTEARETATRLNELKAGWRVSNLKDLLPLRRPTDLAMLEEGARLAGIAE
ncbi:MAG TPA: adenylate/guanylate cyclase domain-containing protein [Roseiarcus sp.]|nr:adenylate/guanylate cyclase domain-containing protein [Roseiarcus sp.]